MAKFICVTCGTQFAESSVPPAHCPICEDERQYIGLYGQQWTTLEAVRESHHNLVTKLEPGLTEIRTDPLFAIGERALLVQTPEGNVLWDCISLVDDATVTAVRSLGGIAAIGISHPHFYSCMVEWSRAFNAPIYLHSSNREYVMRPDPAINYWEGETCSLLGGLSLVRCGGHFEGSTVLHWPAGAEGRGVLLTGDTISVTIDHKFVSFMRSYPNFIPLSARKVRQVVAPVEDLPYDRIYGLFWDRVLKSDAKSIVERSVRRYIQAISD
jgi:glyoxylase-like metal-dependent hydrolase (beta-lactamase superfamily II)